MLCKPWVVKSFQGCTLGGTSAINAGLYFQPPASDWDTYHPPDWHSADVRSATKWLLDRQPPVTSYSSDNQFYAQSGYAAVKSWIVDAAGFQDVSFASEPDNKYRVFGRPVYNYIHGQRGGPVMTYLQTALKRSNFLLQYGVRVKWLEQSRGVATDVVAEVAPGTAKTTCIALSANGRVVLSAGALQSPQILMYSGIGPQDALARLSAKNHTPYNSSSWIVQPFVGDGLFDNPNTFIELSGPSIKSYTYSCTDPIPSDRVKHLSSRSGPYAFAS